MRNHAAVLLALFLFGCANVSEPRPPEVRAAQATSPNAPRMVGPAKSAVADEKPPLVQRPVPAPGATPTGMGQRALEMLVAFLTGTFDTIPQPATEGDSTPVRMHMVPVWPEQKGELWLYQEYAAKADLQHPLRQRLLRFREAGGDLYADAFNLPGNGAEWVGEWGKAKPFASLSPGSLREDARCRMVFIKQMEAVFAGGTASAECPWPQRPEFHERAEFYLTFSSIRGWDRPFDSSGRQVGGPPGPWEFRKISR